MDLPYCAEYAKSGRAGCKGCKSPIAQGSVRLAVMVQSSHYDGKQPQWYHFPCFFFKHRPQSVDDIRKFESLRIEDQIKIQEALTEALSAPSSSGGRGRKRAACPIPKDALQNFRIEYAKTDKALCKKCHSNITLRELRISKRQMGRRFKGVDMWYHVSCFAAMREELSYFDGADRLPGFDMLQRDDQEKVKKILPSLKQEDSPKKTKLDCIEGLTEDQSQSYIEQNKIMFEHRDALKQSLTKNELTELLEYNSQTVPRGIERILDHLADCMTFGALVRCDVCKNGQLVFEKFAYVCLGSLTEWTKCKTRVREPLRVSFEIPPHISAKYPHLLDYKFVARTRVIKQAPDIEVHTPEPLSKAARESRALSRMKFIIFGDPTRGKEALKQQIRFNGGQVVTKISAHEIVAVIASPEEIAKMNNRMKAIKKFNINVVTEDFIDEVPNHEGRIRDLLLSKRICDWGTDMQLDHVLSRVCTYRRIFGGSRAVNTVRLVVKDGTAVDPDSGLEDIAHVYTEESDKFNATLSKTDIQTNQNTFYKIQLLESNRGNDYWVFRSWGRIGTEYGDNKLNELDTLDEAKLLFCQLFEEKTRNKWEDRQIFQKIPGFYNFVDVDYGRVNNTLKRLKVPDEQSNLSLPVQHLMKVIFDVDAMTAAMRRFQLDLLKMPLGKLSERQIRSAFAVLTELQHLIDANEGGTTLIDASNRFYSLIPHSFGVGNPPVLNETRVIEEKVEMLESLLEMEIGYNLTKQLSTVDQHYNQLKTGIEVLEKVSEEYRMIETYLTNTQGTTHFFGLEIKEMFAIKRDGEAQRFEAFRNLHNHKLLWHGSRTTNFAGILSQGLRIAPPEAPCSGYMFGKGVYFADMVSKSAQYCRSFGNNQTGLLLLCDVALGEMYERTRAEFVERLPEGKHSTKGLGRNVPNPEDAVIYDGVEVPLGKQIVLENSPATLMYNEYIVYDVAQINIKYLVEVRFTPRI